MKFSFNIMNLLIYILTDDVNAFAGARCSSVVKTFAHGAMGRRIDPS